MSIRRSRDERRYLAKQYGDDRNLAARQSIYAFQRPGLRHLGRFARPRASCAATRRSSTSAAATACISARCAAARHRGSCAARDLRPGCCGPRARWRATARCSWSTRRRCRSADDASTSRWRCTCCTTCPIGAPAIARAAPRRAARRCRAGRSRTPTRHFAELDDLLVECAADRDRRSTGSRSDRSSRSRWRAAKPSWRRSSFDRVTAHTFTSELVVDVVEPVLDYARSMSAFVADDSTASSTRCWSSSNAGSRRSSRPTARSAITTASGCFVCR